MPLLTVLLVCFLLSITVEIAVTLGALGLASSFFLAFLFYGTDLVEKKLRKRRVKWPRDYHMWATVFWGIATVFYLGQLTLLIDQLTLPVTYSTVSTIGIMIMVIAFLHTGVFVYFAFRPWANRPRVTVTFLLTAIMLGMLDYTYSLTLFNFLQSVYIWVTNQSVIMLTNIPSVIFALLSIPGIFFSVIYLRMIWKQKSKARWVLLTGIATITPWAFVCIFIVLVPIATYFGVDLFHWFLW